MKNRVSIIVPIYNAEKTLDKCIQSICNQTYQDIEIILVNDGSSDSSEIICHKYCECDSRIRYISQLNRGVSRARNTGLLQSTGEFIQFVDSDDIIDESMTAKMIESMKTNDSDIVICGYIRNTLDNKNMVKYEGFTKRINELENDFNHLYKKMMINVPWNKLYKREKIVHYFDENISLGEDLLFNLLYLDNVDKVTVLEEPLYEFLICSGGSLRNTFRQRDFENLVYIHSILCGLYEKWFGNNVSDMVKNTYLQNIKSLFNKLYMASIPLKMKRDCIKEYLLSEGEISLDRYESRSDAFYCRLITMKSDTALMIYIYMIGIIKKIIKYERKNS